MEIYYRVLSMKWKYRLLVIANAILVYGYVVSNFVRLPVVEQSSADEASDDPRQFAVFSCSTPDSQSHRGYDYAFYLPLTALAWARIDFQSIVLITGTRDEWQRDPALALVLSSLKELQARVVFLDSPEANRPMLSQVARIFVANMEQLQLEADDYLLTSDADLWPLLKSHYDPKPGHSLVLVHSDCCFNFTLAGRTFRMLPMSNIGASVRIWKDIVNYNRPVAFDTESILQYMERDFDRDKIRNRVKFASDEWYFDQKLITVRIADWMERNPDDPVFKVSDQGLERLDRLYFHPEWLSREQFSKTYDSHLPVNATDPLTWASVKRLVRLMYGKQSKETRWCYNYARNFIERRKRSS